MASIEKYKTEQGQQRWRVRADYYDMGGKRQQIKRVFKTAKDANAFAAKVENEKNTGMFAYSKGLTLGAYIDKWLETSTVNVRPSTLASYRDNVRKHIQPLLGGALLERLTAEDIRVAYKTLSETEYCPAKYKTVKKDGAALRVLVTPAKTYSPKTIKNIHNVLHMCLEQAVEDKLIPRNPADYVKLPQVHRKEFVIPEPSQMHTLMDALKETEVYPVILTCAMLGCRRGEALGLYWSDINFTDDTITLRRAYIMNHIKKQPEVGELKTETSRRVLPLPQTLKTELLKIKEEREAAAIEAGTHVVSSPFVFVNAEGQPFRPDSVSRAFKRAAARIGLPNMRLHDCRHTVVTYLLENGENPRSVSEFVGHSTPGFTLTQYAHVLAGSKKRASETIENALFK